MISKEGKNIQSQNAFEYVGGYFLALDMTDRDLQAHFKKQGFPWELSKGQDGFCPISQFISKDKVINPDDLDIMLQINGKVI